MRPAREITAEEENFRTEPMLGLSMMGMIKRDPIEPEPIGTIVIKAFRITGYDQDCDGSLMARLEQIMRDGESTGWSPHHLGVSPLDTLVLTLEEWGGMFDPLASVKENNLDELYQKAVDEAMAIIETMARDILREHSDLEEFVMGMGTCFFTMSEPSAHPTVTLEERAYMKELEDFIDEWDPALYLTGSSMRFTAEGPTRTEW